jgi:predicted acetyltransferase
MRDARPLATEAEFEAFAAIGANAYPGIKVVSPEDRQKLAERLQQYNQAPTVSFHGVFEGDRLLGGMRLHDFKINIRSAKVSAGGVGFVAVDLLHKKQGVAKDLIGYFLRQCQQQGQHMALLYPFRPDFYRKMGFGYGAKISQYRVRPSDLPGTGDRQHVRMLGSDDAEALAACYGRFANERHGLLEKTTLEFVVTLGAPENRVVGYARDGNVTGYMVFNFTTDRPDAVMINDILVKELIYESREALAGLMAFLRTQADQIRRVIFDIPDDTFHHLLFDPRDGSERSLASLYHQTNVQGVGIMHRVVDTGALFGALGGCDFNGQSCSLRIVARDSFLPANDRTTIVRFDQGRPSIRDGGEYDATIELDVAEFSSLLMGAVSFRSLHRYGLAEISDLAAVDLVSRIFAVDEKPICLTWF